MHDSDARISQLLAAALHSPDFALRLLRTSAPPERAEILRRMHHVAQPTAPLPARPGLHKCRPAPSSSPSQDLAAGLKAFARSVRRVG
jgi:hypothetical protein